MSLVVYFMYYVILFHELCCLLYVISNTTQKVNSLVYIKSECNVPTHDY